MRIRLFYALELSQATRDKLADLIDTMQKGIMFSGANPSWVKAESIHLTIKFLGWTDDTLLPAIIEQTEAALEGMEPFAFSVRGVSVFPNPRLPRVIWAGVRKADEELARLHAQIEDSMQTLGFAPEERAFHPHLTLARMKSTKGAAGLMKIVEQHSRDFLGDNVATHLTLFQSDLQPTGAVYTPVRRFDF